MLETTEREISIHAGREILRGDLDVGPLSQGLVIFAHGSGSSRRSIRNRQVASKLREAGLATMLFDLLTPSEAERDAYTRQFRFDIEFLARRLADVTKWLRSTRQCKDLKFGYFGASTGAAAALVAAAEVGNSVDAVVSRGGRPDLAGEALDLVNAPVLLIVGGNDEDVLNLNKMAYSRLRCEKELRTIPGATHLFEEPGTLEAAAELATDWFTRHFA
jgi:pimeloyl-ACP methyl ester carboxylesterase